VSREEILDRLTQAVIAGEPKDAEELARKALMGGTISLGTIALSALTGGYRAVANFDIKHKT